MKIRAAVVVRPGGPFGFVDVDLDAPRRDEVVVRVAASGMCHTDLHARDGHLPIGFPSVLGHEGAGVVLSVGSSVTAVREGDAVVMVAPSCGACANCKRDRSAYCLELPGLKMHGSRADGSVTIRLGEAPIRSAFFQQSSFATHSIATERNVVRLPQGFDLNVAAALSCGVSTGAGVVANVIKPDRGSSFAVIGAGAVGLAALLAARDAGCEPIVAVDIHDNRLRLAAELGATHTFQWKDGHLASSIREVTSGVGVDGVIDTTGLAEVTQEAFPALAAHGTYCLVGTPHRGATISVDMAVALNGRGIRGSIQGDSRPQQFVPRLLELYRSGRFPIDSLIKLYEPSDINTAARDMESGITIKPVIRLGALHEGA